MTNVIWLCTKKWNSNDVKMSFPPFHSPPLSIISFIMFFRWFFSLLPYHGRDQTVCPCCLYMLADTLTSLQLQQFDVFFFIHLCLAISFNIQQCIMFCNILHAVVARQCTVHHCTLYTIHSICVLHCLVLDMLDNVDQEYCVAIIRLSQYVNNQLLGK